MKLGPTTSVASIGLSGMRAAQVRLDVNGHNVANVSTPGFERQRVVQSANVTGGVNAWVDDQREPASPTGEGISRLAEDMVEQRMTYNAYAASAKVLQTDNEMMGTLLDIKA